jgi:uncharacterized protein (TIGR03086 family)
MSATDRRQDLIRAYEHAAEVISGIGPSQLRLPTPCPKYDVASLVDHVVGAGNRGVSIAEGSPLGGDEFPHIELADAPVELRQAGKAAEAAWGDDQKLGSNITMPWGEIYDGYTAVNMFLAELATHTWDLAAATGQLPRLDPTIAPSALDGARSMLKPEYRNMMEEGSPFGSEVKAPKDASDWERLAAFTGRQPRPVLS